MIHDEGGNLREREQKDYKKNKLESNHANDLAPNKSSFIRKKIIYTRRIKFNI